MASILKTLAFAAGAGVALGICTTSGGRRVARAESVRRNEINGDDLIDIEPLLSRLENIERRFDAASATRTVQVPVTELTSRIDAQEAEIERLRGLVDVRVNEMQARLEAEMEARQVRSLAVLEQSIEIRVSDRIAALERKLAEQATSIEELRDRTQDTDANLKRLIVAIEKLVERTQPVVAQPQAQPVLVPFESHLSEAQRQEEAVPEFRSRIFQESDAEQDVQKKTRFPLARIFGMIAVVAIANVLTVALS